MKVALTGHRPQRLGLPENIEEDAWEPIETWILKQLVELYKISQSTDTIQKLTHLRRLSNEWFR